MQHAPGALDVKHGFWCILVEGAVQPADERLRPRLRQFAGGMQPVYHSLDLDMRTRLNL
jgi:hypothetical protein